MKKLLMTVAQCSLLQMLRSCRILVQNGIIKCPHGLVATCALPQHSLTHREMGSATAAPPDVWKLGKLNHVAIAASTGAAFGGANLLNHDENGGMRWTF